MSDLEQLSEQLDRFESLPFLFVGSGLSRRYLGTDSWIELLRSISSGLQRPFGYYRSTANNDLPTVATLIARDLQEVWWTDPQYQESREYFHHALGNFTDESVCLKAEVALRFVKSILNLPCSGMLANEVSLLRSSTIDGIITTNYDTLMESLFPEFKTYVGQNELLFSNPTHVGEIYKIHGSVEAPESLVLTRADYDDFDERNPYLAAKLLTLFVEHPIIFLGYSLTDPNIQKLLRSVAYVLNPEQLRQLQNTLIFVEWDADAIEPMFTPSHLRLDQALIPVTSIRTSSFHCIYSALNELERKFPAKLLRQLKDHVYQLVLHNDPSGLLYVDDIDDETNVEDIDVVFGVGLRERLSRQGYVGIRRIDLLRDAISKHSSYEADRIVLETLPNVLNGRAHVPIWCHLRLGGFLNADGTLRDDRDIHRNIRNRSELLVTAFQCTTNARGRGLRLLSDSNQDFATFAERNSVADVLQYGSLLGWEQSDQEPLRQYLEAHTDAFNGPSSQPTWWAKLVCYYDYVTYGPGSAGKTQRVETLASPEEMEF